MEKRKAYFVDLYLKISGIETATKKVINGLKDCYLGILTGNELKKFNEAFEEQVSVKYFSLLRKNIDEYYSIEELQSLIDFFASDLGRKIVCFSDNSDFEKKSQDLFLKFLEEFKMD